MQERHVLAEARWRNMAQPGQLPVVRYLAGSSFSRSSTRFGSLSEAFFRPPPFCRIGRRVRCERSGFFCNSVKPTAMARLETPLARATSDMPPRPWATLSAAAHNLRVRSSSHCLQLREPLPDLTFASHKNILRLKCSHCYTYFLTVTKMIEIAWDSMILVV